MLITEIDGGVLHRPFGPQIRDGKCEHRPSPRSLSRRISGNIEAKTDDRRRQGVAILTRWCPVPEPASRMHHPRISAGIALLNVLRDLRRDVIEMACVEECCPMPQLFRAVATRSGLVCPVAQ